MSSPTCENALMASCLFFLLTKTAPDRSTAGRSREGEDFRDSWHAAGREDIIDGAPTVLSEEGSIFKFLLCHDASKVGENPPEVEDIDSGLMITDQHGRSGLGKVMFALDFEADAGQGAGKEVEGACDDLVDLESLARDEGEYDRDHDAPYAAYA